MAGLVILALALPYVTWWDWGFATATETAREVPLYLFTAGATGLAGIVLMTWEYWLGAAVAYLAVRAIVTPSSLGLAVVHWVCLGALLYLALSALPPRWARGLRWGLVASGLTQAAYGMIQLCGYDPIWNGWRPTGVHFMHGTVDHPTLYGALCAILAHLGPAWTLPILTVAAWGSGSLLAVVAILGGAVVRWWDAPMVRYGGLLGIAGWLAWTYRMVGPWRAKSADSLGARLTAWSLAWADMDRSWAALLFGYGPGSWWRRVPRAQIAADPTLGTVFYQGHNDLLQLAFEGGLVACALLGLWILSHPAFWTSPAVWALGIVSLGTFPWHVAPVAVTAVAVLALVARAEAPRLSASWRYWQ